MSRMSRIAMIGHGTTHNSPEEQIFSEALKYLLATASSRAISRSSPDANLALIVSDTTPQPESSILSRLMANRDQCRSMFEVMYMLALYDMSKPASPETPNNHSSLNFSIVSYQEEAAKRSRSSYHYPTQHQRDSIATSDHRTTPPPTKRRNFYRKG